MPNKDEAIRGIKETLSLMKMKGANSVIKQTLEITLTIQLNTLYMIGWNDGHEECLQAWDNAIQTARAMKGVRS